MVSHSYLCFWVNCCCIISQVIIYLKVLKRWISILNHALFSSTLLVALFVIYLSPSHSFFVALVSLLSSFFVALVLRRARGENGYTNKSQKQCQER